MRSLQTVSEAGPAPISATFLAVLFHRSDGDPIGDVALVIGGDALQTADRNRLPVDAGAAAGGLARAIAGAPQNAGKDVGFSVENVGVVESSLSD